MVEWVGGAGSDNDDKDLSQFSIKFALNFSTGTRFGKIILVKISPNHNKLESFKIYTERAVEKCLKWSF